MRQSNIESSRSGRPGGAVALAILVAVVSLPRAAAGEPDYDIVVYGGSSAGVAAAVQARRMGKTAVIVSPEKHLGGMSSGGLGFTDTGNKAVIGGIAREFYHRLWLHYRKPEAWKWEKPEEYGNRGQGTPAIDGEYRTMWTFEPHAAERVFEDLIAEASVEVFRDEWLDREKGVAVEDRRIRSLTTLSGKTFRGKAFIDATYEGDLMAAAGVSWFVGRESNSAYGETLNGVQVENARSHQFTAPVDPYAVGRRPGLVGIDDRALMSAPASTSVLIAAALPCTAAHISGVCPRSCSRALGSAPAARSTRMASTFPVRDAVIRAVSPPGIAVFASAPALRRRPIRSALPFSAASASGVTP